MIDRHLFIAPPSLREAIMMQPAIAQHHRAFPHTGLDVVANERVAPLLEAVPEFSDVIMVPARPAARLRTVWQLAAVLRARDYSRSYNLDSAGPLAMTPWMARIGQRRSLDNVARKKTASPVEQYCRLVLGDQAPDAAAIPAPRLSAPESAVAAVNRILGQKFDATAEAAGTVPNSSPLVVMAPGAPTEARRWPGRHFARLAAMVSAHWQHARVVLVGDAGERHLCTEVATLSTANMVNLAGQLDMPQTIALLRSADAVVCNDADILHISAACASRTVAVFGPTDPASNPPLTSQAQCHWLALTCSPCNSAVCPLGHANCLNLLEPVRVFNSIERMIQATDPSRPVS